MTRSTRSTNSECGGRIRSRAASRGEPTDRANPPGATNPVPQRAARHRDDHRRQSHKPQQPDLSLPLVAAGPHVCRSGRGGERRGGRSTRLMTPDPIMPLVAGLSETGRRSHPSRGVSDHPVLPGDRCLPARALPEASRLLCRRRDPPNASLSGREPCRQECRRSVRDNAPSHGRLSLVVGGPPIRGTRERLGRR